MRSAHMPHRNVFHLSPDVAQVILGGSPFIDKDGLNIPSPEQARDFALGYGYDMDQPHRRAIIRRTLDDALAFLEDIVLEGTGLAIPRELAELDDPLELLTLASAWPRDEMARWSCAVLRVMHTLLYIDNNIFLRFLPEIQQQIFDRYDRYLVIGKNGGWMLSGKYEVPLIDVKRKEGKNRNSMLLKLLHKPENVAETIYDYVGMRIVAEDLLDVLRVVKFLIEHNVFQAANIMPSRTRNLMVDVALLEEWAAGQPVDFSTASLTKAERQAIAENLAHRVGRPSVNPYSGSDYSALQFTVNTLIRVPGPGASALQEALRAMQERGAQGEAGRRLITDLIKFQEEFTFFFAHEVQIMEKTGFNNSRMGPASHVEYKRRQREAVCKRVLRGIWPPTSQGG